MGYLPPTIKYLNNVQPNKDEPSTWQDSYFENAIRIIRKDKPAIPKAYKYIQIGNDKPISFCQKVYEYEKQREHKLIDQYPIGDAKYPIGDGDAKYPIGGGDVKELNNSNIDKKTPKCVKCYNVVLENIVTKSLALSKYYTEKTYLDNPTALEIELHKYSMHPIKPIKNLNKEL